MRASCLAQPVAQLSAGWSVTHIATCHPYRAGGGGASAMVIERLDSLPE